MLGALVIAGGEPLVSALGVALGSGLMLLVGWAPETVTLAAPGVALDTGSPSLEDTLAT
jgi:hypothetical protein